MSRGVEAIATLETLWAPKGIRPADLVTGDDGTLVASDRRALSSYETVAAGDTIDDASWAASPESFTPGELLGSGGMGEVRLATQPSLRREVAMKVVHAPARPGAIDALLKEAWVGGLLEHPNLVPVHTLASDAGSPGSPAIIMKRVVGRTLEALLEAPSDDPEARLEEVLERILDVCRGIELAHERGVLHLDLKPANVLIGDFGEVYVVDWGLAAALPHGPAWLPRASSIATIAGTPAYIAPELAAAEGARVDARTDVYLIGATLAEVLRGRPPHVEPDDVPGAPLMQLARAYDPTPVALFDGDPAAASSASSQELAAIVHRAMAFEPAERFPDVASLRRALEAHLVHRRAERFVERARELLAGLRGATADATEAPELARPGAAREPERGEAPGSELEAALAGCEQALRQARTRWADHPALPELECALLRTRFAHAVRQERVDAAAAWLAELAALLGGQRRQAEASPERGAEPAASPLGDVGDERAQLAALRARLEALDAHVARLEALAHELDLSRDHVARRRLFFVLGLIWAVAGVGLGVSTRSGWLPFGYRELLVEGALLVGMLGPFAWLRRRTLFSNRANRRLYAGLVMTAVVVELMWVAGWLLELPPLHAAALTPLIYTFCFATLGLVLERRFLPGAAVLAVAAIAAPLAPEFAYDLVGLGGFAATLAVLGVWRTEERDAPARA